MKVTIIKRLIEASPVFVFVCCLCCACSTEAPKERLVADQIEVLREQYPLCGKNVPPMANLTTLELDEVKEIVDTFVYGEVVGEMSTYDVPLDVGNDELAEKRKNMGIVDIAKFYEYTISVIADSEGKYSKGDIITITSNIDLIDYNPKLSDGMKIVVPSAQDKDKPTRTHFCLEGMYYVTADEYAIAAFDEKYIPVSKNASSGVKVEALLKELKK